MGKIMDISGHTYNGIKVISYSHTNVKTYWNLVCHCGKEFKGRSNNLRTGHLKSCGCIKSILTSSRFRKHGESHHCTKEYRAWCSIRKRCFNKNEPLYYTYGGRGITVCDRWLNSYENFLSDLGRAPSSKHSIDRIDVNGNYEPSNCRWATDKEQALNKTVTSYIVHNGIKQPLQIFCELYNLKIERVRYWFRKGLSSNEILSRWNTVSSRLYANSTFTKIQISVIREAVCHGHSLTKIGRYFKTTKGTIWKIKSGYSWQSV